MFEKRVNLERSDVEDPRACFQRLAPTGFSGIIERNKKTSISSWLPGSNHCRYCSLLTCSIQSTTLPSSFS